MIRKVQGVYDSKLTAKKGTQTNQWEKLTELRKSDKAVQCVNFQIWNHSNKVLVSKDFNRLTVLSMSSNVWALCSSQVNHIRHTRTIFQTFEDWIPNQFHHAERRDCPQHHPLSPKQGEDFTWQGMDKLAMEQ